MNLDISEILSNIEPLASAAAGGFFGAMSAFWFETWKSKRNEEDQKYKALFNAHYILMAQHNFVLNLKNEYLNTVRDDERRFVALHQFMMSETEMRVDYGGISFVAADDDPNILRDIHLAELAYENVIKLLPLRNSIYEKLLKDNENNIQEFDFETGRVRFAAPLHETYKLKQITDQLYEIADDTDSKYEEIINEVYATVKRMFPKRKAMKYEVLHGNPKNA